MRKIIHCDADCFFAAIEMRDDPRLRDRPLAVGGSPDRRGVISTCNYLARQYGVRSAMASAHARKLCPDLTIVPHNMEKYRQAAQAMREIFYQYTDLVEPLSLDEAYLDVSDSDRLYGSATLIAREIRQRIARQLDITVSAGVANSKFLAKIASDWRKPDGLVVIRPDQVEDFVLRLPVNKLHGVGRVTTQRLHQLGIEHCADLKKFSQIELCRLFGSFGLTLHQLCRGIDLRPVNTHRQRKSLSVEHTYSQDLTSDDVCQQQLPNLFSQLQSRILQLKASDQIAKAFVKIKFSDFSTTTLERVGTKACLDDYQTLLSGALRRANQPVRLLGIGVRFVGAKAADRTSQLELFSGHQALSA